MRTIILATIATASLLAGGALQADKDAIAGSWKVAACELESKLLPETAFKDLTYHMAGNGTWKLDGGPGFPKSKGGAFTLNPTVTPKTIDMIPADGPHQGKMFRGIYQLEGDELKACFAFPGKERPKTFLTEADSGLVLEFWRRTKK